jgi:hypothetical protein
MRTANRHVHLPVTDGQCERMKKKASEYGIPLKRLVLLAVEAYSRAYDEVPDRSSLVVVNYGTWYKMDFRLQVIRRDLDDIKYQLAALRAAARRRQDEGTTKAVDECAKEMARMAADVALCKDVLNRIAEMPLLADPYAGPLEGASTEGDASRGDDDGEGL